MTQVLQPSSSSNYIRDPWKDEELSQVNVDQLSASLISKLIASRDQTPAPQGISSSVSSIEASTATKPPQFRPELPSPEIRLSNIQADVSSQQQKHKKNPQLRFAQQAIRHDQFDKESAPLFEEQINFDVAQLKRVHEELKAATARYSQSEKEEKRWGVLQTVLQYFASASAIVFGVALVASGVGVAAGAFLIAAGGIGLVNQIMTDTHAWEALIGFFTKNQELQTKIASRIQTGMVLLSLALSLTGGALALQTNAITEIANVEKALKIVTLATGILGAFAGLITGAIKNRSCQIKAEITSLEGEATDLKYNIKKTVSSMKEFQKSSQEMFDALKRAMQDLEVQAS